MQSMERTHARVRARPTPSRPAGGAAALVPRSAPGAVLALQRTAGNAAVAAVLRADAAAPAPTGFMPAANAALDVSAAGPDEFSVALKNYEAAYVPYTDNCADAALQTLQNLAKGSLYAQKGHQPGLRTYDRSNPKVGSSGAVDAAQTDLNWNVGKVHETVDYIKGAIDRGRPLYVGVNEGGGGQAVGTGGRFINEGVTDHFLIIAGYTARKQGDGTWTVTKLQAIDNATDDPVAKFPTFDVSDGAIRKPATGKKSRFAADAEYQLTQVRVYKDDVEAAKQLGAWWD
jgi:hypothetical protein